MNWFREEEEYTYASDSDWDRAEAYELGARDRDRASKLTDKAIRHNNTFYHNIGKKHRE